MTLRLGGDGAITGCTSLEEPTISISGLTMTTPIEAISGTAAAPSYTFSGDTDNGLYYAGTNSVGVSTAGTSAIVVDSSQNVGIGASPSAKLHVSSTAAVEALVSGGGTSGDTVLHLKGNGNAFKFIVPNSASQYGMGLYDVSNAAYRMFVNSSGNIGIGTTGPSAPLHVEKTDATAARIGGSSYYLDLGQYGTGSSPAITYNGSGASLVFRGGSTERMRIDSSGRLLVGTSSSRDDGVSLQVEGVGYLPSTIQITRNSANTDGGGIYIQKTRGNSNGSTTIVQNGDELGYIKFRGADGTDAQSVGTAIRSYVDGTPGPNDMPGRLVFFTTADGASSPTERMRINNNGYVRIMCQDFGAEPSNTNQGVQITNPINTASRFSSGSTTSSVTQIAFVNGNGVVGTIVTNGSATAYNTSSDYRLKENVVDVADGITRVKQLQPKRFNFIADDTTTVDGFIAHEVQTVVPEAVTGEKDAVDDEGNPQYQGIDQSKLVPLLTAALQEAIIEIEGLKQRLNDAGL